MSNPVVGPASQQVADKLVERVDQIQNERLAESFALAADGGYTIGEQYEWTEQSELQWWLEIISQGPSWRPIGS